MVKKDAESAELWAGWAHEALGMFVMPDEIDGDVADDAVDFAAAVADAMLEEYLERFGGGKPRRRGRRAAQEEQD